MKTEEQIKEMRIQIGGDILNLSEALNTFESCMGRKMTSEENNEMVNQIAFLGGQSAMLNWILESNQRT